MKTQIEDLLKQAADLSALQQYPEAIECLSKALKPDPKNHRALLSRGWIYQELNKNEEALADYTAAINVAGSDFYNIEQNMNTSRAYLFRGHTYMAMGKFQEAVKDYTGALAIYVRPYMQLKWSAHTFIKRAAAFEKLERPDLAKDDYEMALSLNPKEPDASFAKGRLAVVSKQIEDVMSDIKRISL